MALPLDAAAERHSCMYQDGATDYTIPRNLSGKNVNDLNMCEFSKQLDQLCCIPFIQPAQEPSTHVTASTPEVQQTVHPVLMPELQRTVQPVLMQEPTPEQARADFHVNSQIVAPQLPLASSIHPPPVCHAVSRRARRTAPKQSLTDDLNRSLISSRQPAPAACDVATTDRPAARASRPYIRFNKATLQSLNAWFDRNRDNPYPDVFARHRLEKEGNLTASQVKRWFNNRRKKAKKESSPASSTATNF